MLDGIRHYTSVAACLIRLSLQRQFEYPSFLFSWLLMIPINYFSGVWMLKILIDSFQPLAGWTFPQVAFLYGLALVSHGLQIVFAIQSWYIEFYVTRGGFDRMLLRPMNVFFQFTFDYTNLIGVIDLLTGVVLFAIGCRLVEFAWTVGNIVKLLFVILGGALIRIGFYTTLCSIAFWTKRSLPLRQLGHDLLWRTTFYPLSIYPRLLQTVLTFAIPIGFITFYPACEFLGQDARTSLPLDLAVWTPLVGILSFALSQLVFRLGLRNYESAGT